MEHGLIQTALEGVTRRRTARTASKPEGND
jgi:hypothetical protein